MSLFKKLMDVFSGENTESGGGLKLSAESKRLFDAYLNEAFNMNAYDMTAANSLAAKEISEAAPELQMEILKESMRRHNEAYSYSDHITLKQLEEMLLRKHLKYSEEDILTIFAIAGSAKKSSWSSPHSAWLAGIAERYSKENQLSDDVKLAFQSLVDRLIAESNDASSRKLVRALTVLLSDAGEDIVPFAVNGYEAWGAKAIADIRALPDEPLLNWKRLLEYATTCSGSTPSKRWQDGALKYLQKVDQEVFVTFIDSWFSLVGTRGTYPEKQRDRYAIDPNETLTSESADLLKGLAWISIQVDDPRLARALGDAANASFKKVVNVGPRCPKLGNACVGALSNLKSKEAIAQLGRLKSSVKHASTRNTIEKALNNAATRAGMSVQDLEELNVPDYGFTEVGKLVQNFEAHRAEIVIDDSSVSVHWFDATDKEHKSIPARVKSEHPDEVKALKKTLGDVEKQLSAIRYRIETSLIRQRHWAFKDLKERYLEHPIAATIARRLIWRVNGKSAIYLDGEMVDVQSCRVETPDNAIVELWHPIASEAEEVLAWRMFLRGHEITQPFKQAHREIYILTPAEIETDTYSNRFAAHVLKQHQFNQLCQQRGWKYRLQGAWDSYNTPYLELPQWDLIAEFFVEPVTDEASATGIFTHCVSDQLRFRRSNGESVSLVEIMPIVLTEVMRDLDLFVGVCSIGNDPTWIDAGDAHHGYWHAFSFGDLSASAETRKDVLKEILPALKIKARCRIEGKFLIVQGDIRTYKIHLGSGNILMEPNDQYLCIVPERGGKSGGTSKIYLPFEGDGVLSVILSKAMMLANDSKITDPTIVRQINFRT